MSSEMRELFRKCEGVLNDMRGISPCLTEQMEGYLEQMAALLTRTEAGDERTCKDSLQVGAANRAMNCGAAFQQQECAEASAAPVADGAVDLYGPLTGAQEASMRGNCMTHLRTVEVEYPDTGKFIRDWLTHVESERNRLFDALRAHPQDASAVAKPAEVEREEYCGHCGTWLGYPLICCEGRMTKVVPNITKSKAEELRAALHQPAKGGAL